MSGVPKRSDALTPREQEILSMVAEGFSNQEIADALVISERTARSHVHAILSKYGVKNRTEVAMIYRDETGMVDDREIRRLREKLAALQQEYDYIRLVMDKFAQHLAEAL